MKQDINLSIETYTKNTGLPVGVSLSMEVKDQDQKVWKKGFKSEGTSVSDAVENVTRHKLLPATINMLIMLAGTSAPEAEEKKDDVPFNPDGIQDAAEIKEVPQRPAQNPAQASIEQQRAEFYAKLNKDIQKWKVGKIREFITTQGLNVRFSNGEAKESIYQKIKIELEKREKEMGK